MLNDTAGKKLVNRQWKSYGTTVVNNNFVRLTPDRQSKKGAIWSQKPLGVDSFSTILKFRISGQGKNFFGDGIAMWLVNQKFQNSGSLHGFHEKFTGVGIIFDTFKNTENMDAHRDVMVLVNDGERTMEMMTSPVLGCNNMNFRYHADAGDFSVTDASRVKVLVEGRNLHVWMDTENTGEWTKCVSVEDMPLKEDWAVDSHIGITGSTGQLADNHDLLSLATYSDSMVMEVQEVEKFSKKEFPVSDLETTTTMDR
jgi:mannose-binding lectin 2